MASTSRSKPTRRPPTKPSARRTAKARAKTKAAAPSSRTAAPVKAKSRTTQSATAAVGRKKLAPAARKSAKPAARKVTKPATAKSTTKQTAVKSTVTRKSVTRKSAIPESATKKPTASKSLAGKKQVKKTPPMKTTSRKPAARVSAAEKKPAPRKTAVKAVRAPINVPESQPVFDLAAHDRALSQRVAAASVNRALDMFESLARGGPGSLQRMAEAAKCGKTVAQETLNALRDRGFVISDEATGLWRLGARWSVLGDAASEQGALAATAMPHLIALGQVTGENVYLRTREGMEVVTAAVHQTDPNLRIYTEVGKVMPLHAGTGRLLLAYAPEAVQTQVLAQRLARYTPSTRTDPTWIAADLHRIRQRGFLITDSEVVAGTVTVCAPVRDASGQVVAALLIAAPSLRMRPPRPRGLMPAVVEAARKLSEALGAAPEPVPLSGPVAVRHQGQITAPSWTAHTAAANGAPSNGTASTAQPIAIARPHSIFR